MSTSDGDAPPGTRASARRRSTTPGPNPPYEHLDVEQKYSWLKTPRWKGHPMEVGPLARLLVGYASGRQDVKEVVDEGLRALDAPVAALFSTLGRTAARGLETRLVARWALEFMDQLMDRVKKGAVATHDGSRWNQASWPSEARGVGMTEAPRGALSHWIVIKDRKIGTSSWSCRPPGTPRPATPKGSARPTRPR